MTTSLAEEEEEEVEVEEGREEGREEGKEEGSRMEGATAEAAAWRWGFLRRAAMDKEEEEEGDPAVVGVCLLPGVLLVSLGWWRWGWGWCLSCCGCCE